MDIIENNFEPHKNSPYHNIVCPHCNSKLRYYGSDIYAGNDYDYIICPCCNQKIDMSEPIICEICGNNFIGKEYIGAYGLYFADCPHCGNAHMLEKGEFLTADNVKYPEHFGSYANAVSVQDSEINKWIKNCINNLDKDVDYAFEASGDTAVIAFKCDEASHLAQVIVAKKYQETEIEIPADKY